MKNSKEKANLVKVVALTVGNENTASTQYRLLQYHAFLEENGIAIEYIHRNAIDHETIKVVAEADVLFNQKCLIRNSLAKKLIRAAKRVIFDFDDALWTRPGKPYSFTTQLRVNTRFKTWLNHSDVVLCANQYLADYARAFTDRVQVLSMALDMGLWYPETVPGGDGAIRIGWAGAPGNLRYLESLDNVLCELCRRYANLEVRVYCGKKPSLSCPYVHVPFNLGTEPSFARSLDIGLLPLEDQDFHRGKSPIKAIQYLASGVVAVGNTYGATAEILRPEHSVSVDSDWVRKLSDLIDDVQSRKAMTSVGLEFARQQHNTEICGQQLLKAITGGL